VNRTMKDSIESYTAMPKRSQETISVCLFSWERPTRFQSVGTWPTACIKTETMALATSPSSSPQSSPKETERVFKPSCDTSLPMLWNFISGKRNSITSHGLMDSISLRGLSDGQIESLKSSGKTPSTTIKTWSRPSQGDLAPGRHTLDTKEKTHEI
jgi:hypothetical protein